MIEKETLKTLSLDSDYKDRRIPGWEQCPSCGREWEICRCYWTDDNWLGD